MCAFHTCLFTNKWIDICEHLVFLRCDACDKSCIMVSHNHNHNHKIQIDNEEIDRVYKTKFLGVIIDYKITWKEHVIYVSGKMSRSIGILVKARSCFNKDAMMTLYYIFIYPYMTYCNNVWGSTYASNTEKVYNLQKRALRIMFNIGKRESVIPMFTEMCILKFPDINVYLTSRFMFRYHHGLVPGIFHGYFTPNTDVHKYYTRQSTYFHILLSWVICLNLVFDIEGRWYGMRYSSLVLIHVRLKWCLWNRLNRVCMTLRSSSQICCTFIIIGKNMECHNMITAVTRLYIYIDGNGISISKR